MKMIVTGSRGITHYKDTADHIARVIDQCGRPSEIISGMCKLSPDIAAQVFAMGHDIPFKGMPARWVINKDGERDPDAGFKRNIDMALYARDSDPDNTPCIVAIWDGTSHGTAHMIAVGQLLGFRVMVCMMENFGPEYLATRVKKMEREKAIPGLRKALPPAEFNAILNKLREADNGH